MKLFVFWVPLGWAACVTLAVVAAPPQESEQPTGGASWSHRYSYHWGDAPRVPPHWPAPPPAAVPDVPLEPLPGWGPSFRSMWRPPAGAFLEQAPGTSHATSFVNTPVVSALATAQGLICGHLVLTPQAADVLRSTGRVVTFSATDLSGEQLVAKILEGSGCTATRLSERIVIYVAGQEVEEGQIEAKGLAFEKFQIERALARPVNLTMHFTPLPFAIQMLEEISGVRIELPPQYQKRFYASQPLVSVSAHGQPLAEVLKDVARQIGAELTTDRGAIQLQIKSAN